MDFHIYIYEYVRISGIGVWRLLDLKGPKAGGEC